jgi:5-methylcytosine-specific restriction endonuclease McrA
MKLLKREEFKEKVFDRDNNICVNCNDIAVDAHHIVERKLFEDGGYYLENGVSLCSKCHLLAEQTILSCD